MGDASPEVKKLLEIPESDTSPLKPINGYQEILKEGKVYHSDFTNDAKDYLNTPNTYKCHMTNDYFPYDEKPVPIVAKNSANLVNIIAAARPL